MKEPPSPPQRPEYRECADDSETSSFADNREWAPRRLTGVGMIANSKYKVRLDEEDADAVAARDMEGATVEADATSNDGTKRGRARKLMIPASSPPSSRGGVRQTIRPISVGNELWRTKRIGRGVPRSENEAKPRMQDVAHSDADTMRLLEERGQLTEVPDIPGGNILKNLTITKTEWLYTPVGSELLLDKQREIQQAEAAGGRKHVWTVSGRLICADDQPPTKAIPSNAMRETLPPHLRPRPPMTRSEVTEQRIIKAAAAPPPQPPSFELAAEEAWRLQPRSVVQGTPLSGRPSPLRGSVADSLETSPQMTPTSARHQVKFGR